MGRAEMDPSTNPFADELDDEVEDPREPGEDFDNEDEDVLAVEFFFNAPEAAAAFEGVVVATTGLDDAKVTPDVLEVEIYGKAAVKSISLIGCP